MTVKIGSNSAALQVQRRLDAVTSRQSAIFQRLASGSRIARPSDDGASLAIASALNAQGRVLSQSVRNINDGISALSVAESALKSLIDISERQKELATQAASSVYSASQRSAMQAEADALSAEYNRILESTAFNGSRLLQAGGRDITLQSGIGTEAALSINVGQALSVNQTTQSLGTSFNFTSTAGGVGEQTTVVVGTPVTGGYSAYTDEISVLDLSTVTPGSTFTVYDANNTAWDFEFVRGGDSPSTGNYSIYYDEQWISNSDWYSLADAVYTAMSNSGANTWLALDYTYSMQVTFTAYQATTDGISGSGVTVSTTQQGGQLQTFNPNAGTIQFQAADGTNYYVWVRTLEDDGMGGYNEIGTNPGGLGTAIMVDTYAGTDSAADLAVRISSAINANTGGRVAASATGAAVTFVNNGLGNVTNSTATGIATVYTAGTKDGVLSAQAEVSRFSYGAGSSFIAGQYNTESARIGFTNNGPYSSNYQEFPIYESTELYPFDPSTIATGDSFVIYNNSVAYNFDFEVDGGTSGNSGYHHISISSTDQVSDVAYAVESYISTNLSSAFSVSTDGRYVTITSHSGYDQTDSSGSSSGFSVSTTTQGGSYWDTVYPDLGAFKIYDNSGTSYEFYYVHAGSYQSQRFGDANYSFQIDVSDGDYDTDVISKTATALSGAIGWGADFSYSNSGNYLDITQNTAGDVTNAEVYDPAVGYATTLVPGYSESPYTGLYTRFSTPSTNYYVWYKVDGTGSNPSAANPGRTGIQVNVSSSWSSDQIASAVASAINTATAGAVSASASGGDVTITNTATGPASNATAGNAWPVVNAYTITPGSNAVYFSSTNHGMNTGDKVRYTTSGVAHGGLTSGTDYYIIRDSANTFRLATSASNANSGIAATLTKLGTGTQTITRYDGAITSSITMDASPLDLSSVSSARTALTDLEAQIARISNEISSIGTYQSRLGYAISETRVRADANTEVYSRMTSADVASEAADLVRTQILQRSATSVLAQANQLPAVALALLRS